MFFLLLIARLDEPSACGTGVESQNCDILNLGLRLVNKASSGWPGLPMACFLDDLCCTMATTTTETINSFFPCWVVTKVAGCSRLVWQLKHKAVKRMNQQLTWNYFLFRDFT